MITIPIDVVMPSDVVSAKLVRLALDNAEQGQSRTFVRMETQWGPPRPPGEAREIRVSLLPCTEDEASFAIDVERGKLAVRIGDDE